MDIYIRRAYTTKNFSENTIEISDNLELFLQEIEMILSTPSTSVIGSSKFGCSLEAYIHTFGVNESDIRYKIQQQIQQYSKYSSVFDYQINVEFYNIDESTSAIVEIIVEKDNSVRIVFD